MNRISVSFELFTSLTSISLHSIINLFNILYSSSFILQTKTNTSFHILHSFTSIQFISSFISSNSIHSLSSLSLSRELSLEEIEYICKNTNVEIETFIHGALCISYSGQCLFSSMIGGRSGNRGKCAQPCRLPYELLVKDINSNIRLIFR